MTFPPPAPATNGHYYERRSAPRQRRCTRILFLAEDSVLEEPFGGWLLDTSATGLRLACRLSDIGEGTHLYIRPPAAPAGTPWITVTVKNRRMHRDRWEIGCQFTPSLSEHSLELFAS
jgi:hypothetical protein